MKKKLKLIASIAFYTVFALVLVLVVLMMSSRAKGEVFFLGNRAYIWVMTDSMADEIPASTYICIRREHPQSIEVGDVITFYSDDPQLGGSLNTHRVVDIKDGGAEFVTKGDNNLIEDRYTAKAEKVVGVYEKSSPVLTAIGRVFQSGVGIVLVMSVVAVITFFSLFYDKLKSICRQDKTNKK